MYIEYKEENQCHLSFTDLFCDQWYIDEYDLICHCCEIDDVPKCLVYPNGDGIGVVTKSDRKFRPYKFTGLTIKG